MSEGDLAGSSSDVKRYLLFAGHVYYPKGGWGDLRGSFDSRDQAVTAGEASLGNPHHDLRWYHVVDARTGQTLAEGETP